jgi:hypothetical protein
VTILNNINLKEVIMKTYTYYRATEKSEATAIVDTDQLLSERGVSYWTDGIEPARGYKLDGRVIVRIVLDRPLPEGYKGVALGEEVKDNHVEWVVPKTVMNEQLCNLIEQAEIVEV